jgi:hypothetical protein
VQVHYDEGIANHIGPEPCAGIREDVGEASVGERAGQPLSRDRKLIPGADAVCVAEGNMSKSANASAWATRRGRRTWHATSFCTVGAPLTPIAPTISPSTLMGNPGPLAEGVMTFGQAPQNSRGGLMLPLEGNRWMATIGGRHGDVPSGDAQEGSPAMGWGQVVTEPRPRPCPHSHSPINQFSPTCGVPTGSLCTGSKLKARLCPWPGRRTSDRSRAGEFMYREIARITTTPRLRSVLPCTPNARCPH